MTDKTTGKTPVAKEGSKDDITSKTADKENSVLATQTGPTAIGDPSGVYTNRADSQGTIQREPTAEELPSDAKIAPIAEQINPNGAAQAVGALPTPETVSGVDQPEEGEKQLQSDASDAATFLPKDSKQADDAKIANEDAARDHDRGRV